MKLLVTSNFVLKRNRTVTLPTAELEWRLEGSEGGGRAGQRRSSLGSGLGPLHKAGSGNALLPTHQVIHGAEAHRLPEQTQKAKS